MRTIPNLLTLLRLVAVPFFIAASVRGMFTLALIIFVSAAATDILDGMIARRFNQRSRIGALLDPIADKTIMVSGFIFYTLSNRPLLRIPGWLTYVVFIRDFLILMVAYLLYTRVRITRFPPTVWGKTSTVLQAGTLGTLIAVNAFLPVLRQFVEVLFRLSLLMTLFSGWHYMQRAALMLREDAPARAA